MSIQRVSILALAAAGGCMLSNAGVAGVSVVDGHLVNDQNQRVTLQVSPVPLSADVTSPISSAALFRSTTLAFGVSRNSIQLPKQGGPAASPIEITDRSMVGWGSFSPVGGGVNFIATRNGNELNVTAPNSNRTCRTIADQLTLFWIHPFAGNAFAAVNASQWSLGPCPPPKNTSLFELPSPDSALAPMLTLNDTDVDRAVRNRSSFGSNAVQILLSAADVTSDSASPRLTRILEACERHRMWCLLDPGLARTDADAKSDRGAEYFARPAVRAELLNREYVMFVIPPTDSATRSLRTIRAAGLPHVTMVSPKPLTSGGVSDALTLLGTDPHHAVVLMGTQDGSGPRAGAVPMLTLPASPASATAGEVRSGVFECKTTFNKGEDLFLSVDCAASVPHEGAGILFPIELRYAGGSEAPRLGRSHSWFSAYWDAGEKVIKVSAQAAPDIHSRVGFLRVERRDDTGAVAWAYVQIIQASGTI